MTPSKIPSANLIQDMLENPSKNPLTRELEKAVGVPKFIREKFPPKTSAILEKYSPDFPRSQHAIPVRVWAISGNQKGSDKNGLRSNTPGRFFFLF